MEYCALTIGLTDELFSGIQAVLTSSNLRLTPSLTLKDAGHMLDQQMFQLLIVELEYLRNIGQTDWLDGIRQITLIPIVILSNNPKQDTHPMIELGADLCVYGKNPCSVIADLSFAQLRRFTEYNQNRIPIDLESSAFRMGDIFIDPARHIVEVSDQTVNLRPREFSLLLYFMQNPNIVLTPDQICENAWGMAYTQTVGKSVHELRRQIKEKTGQSCHIQTIYRVGYRFVAYYGKTCDN